MFLDQPVRSKSRDVALPRGAAVGAVRYAPLIATLVTLVLHLAGNPHYGFFRDELYFIICGRHPAFGYVDQPPLSPLLAAFSQSFGPSLFALRAVPAVFAAVATYATVLFVIELGGGLFAILLSALVVIVSPEMMAFGLRLSPDMVEMAVWPLIALIALKISKGADQRLWLFAGVLTALAGWSKYSVAFFGVALIAGAIITRRRDVLLSWWLLAGVALAFALMVPNIWWQWHYHFPMLQLLHNDYGKFLLEWPPFPMQQIMIMSPLLSLVWLIGLWWLLWKRPTRFLGYAYLILIAIMWALDAKNYYPAPVYPYLIAAGAVPIERWTVQSRGWRIAVMAIVVAFAIPSTPFVLPVLPMRTFIVFQEGLGKIFHIKFHVDKNATNATPIQYYADMTGWDELTQDVARVYDSLPAKERAQTAIYAHNFGEAAAIDFFGPKYGLPRAISGNNNYWIWGPRGYTGSTVVAVNARELPKYYDSVRRAAMFHNPLGMPYENDFPIDVLRDPKAPLSKIWPSLRNYSYAFGGL